ncbi:hypothetical protein SM124_08475 [Bacillus sp. 31A1R]|uniref:Uncharacterized protein n=1 Tax=Robertmurraya mangrovi TaxID=3098077 RepID=A0ABU5IXD7_9BACI|nr:hypothetical protein [Bacillus sp. 31A1R]MDZ5471781.1 hypothetical protein [Bacillus sp. 31A1R]
MKQIFLFAAIVGAVASLYYLYQWQLGAIPFFLLAIFFFSLAMMQLKRHAKKNDDQE